MDAIEDRAARLALYVRAVGVDDGMAAIAKALDDAERRGAAKALREASREFRRHGLGAEPPADILDKDDARRAAWDDAADWCDMRAAHLPKPGVGR